MGLEDPIWVSETDEFVIKGSWSHIVLMAIYRGNFLHMIILYEYVSMYRQTNYETNQSLCNMSETAVLCVNITNNKNGSKN